MKRQSSISQSQQRQQCSSPVGLDDAIAALETEAVRRALSGVRVPVFHQGRECGDTVKHSDQLLMFLLKTLRPERYGAGKEPVQSLERRMVTLDVDLSAAQEEAEAEEEEMHPPLS